MTRTERIARDAKECVDALRTTSRYYKVSVNGLELATRCASHEQRRAVVHGDHHGDPMTWTVDTAKLRALADWLDAKYPQDKATSHDEVQRELRTWAAEIDALKARVERAESIRDRLAAECRCYPASTSDSLMAKVNRARDLVAGGAA